jgi:hypothetical protein
MPLAGSKKIIISENEIVVWAGGFDDYSGTTIRIHLDGEEGQAMPTLFNM